MKNDKTNLFRHLPIVAIELDQKLNITSHSPLLSHWTGDDTSANGSNLKKLLPKALSKQLQNALKQSQAGHYAECDVKIPAHIKGTKAQIYRVCITPEEHYNKTRMLLTAVKTAEQQEQILPVEELDPLTRLPNRYAALKILEQEAGQQLDKQSFYLLFIDLDRFKMINDTYGHQIGDEVLIGTVQRLRLLIDEKQGDMLARIGGDEFIILLKSADNEAAADTLCQNILQTMETPFILAEHTIFTSCSIGISRFPAESSSSNELISQADTAMHHAKLENRNTFRHYTRELGASFTRRTLIANTLRHQLHNHSSPIFLMFQPIVNLENERTVAAEALLRWEKLDKYQSSVNELVSIIEEHGMIMEVGNHVIDMSMSSLHQLLDCNKNAPFYLSINASPIQVAQKGFGASFIDSFSNERLAAECISLEITESALIQDVDTVHENLTLIREAGFNLAIDDFGTGYSSLSYLEKYPFTHLKIDKSFIDHIPGNNQKTHLLDAIMDISRAFNMKVIAEGIESREQLAYLREIGCHLGQGYYFGRPEPLEQFRKRLQQNNRQPLYAEA